MPREVTHEPGLTAPSLRWPGARRVVVLVRHNFALITREPGPLISRLLQPLALILLMRPLYVAALARDGAQAGTTQVVAPGVCYRRAKA